MQTAVNPQTGETAVLVGDKWQKAEHVATNPQGQKAYLVGGQWMNEQGPSDLPAPAPNKAIFSDKVRASVPYQALRGMADPAVGLAQLFGRGAEAVTSLGGVLPNSVSEYFKGENQALDQFIKEDEARISASRRKVESPTMSSLVTGEQDPGMSWARIAGNVVSPINFGIAKMLPTPAGATAGRTAWNAAKAGAVAGSTQAVEDTDNGFWGKKSVQAGLGAGTSAAVAPALNKLTQAIVPRINAAITKLSGAGGIQGARSSMETDQIIAQALKEAGQNIEDLPQAYMQQLRQQVVEALKAGRRLDPATVMRADDFKALGVVPTKGQITRDATQFAAERNLRGVSGAGQPLMDRFASQNQRLAELLDPKAPKEAFQAGELISNTLKSADEGMRGKVSALYRAARQESGKDATVPLQGLAQDAAGVLDDFGDKVPGAVRSRLASFGILGGNQSKVYSPEEADKLLKLINDHVGADAATNRALDRLRSAVKRTMTEGGVDDVFAGARSAAAKRFELHDLIPALDDAAQGKSAPDDFVRRFIVNGKAKDVQAMAELLRQTNPEAADEARKQLAAVLQRSAFGENKAGDKLFSPERFAQTLRNIGSEKLKAFFSPGEIEQFHTISRVGAYINSTPSAAPVNTSNTGAMVTNAMAKMLPHTSSMGLASAVLAPVLNSVKNARAVDDALSNVGPVSSRNITPEQARRLAQFLTGSAVAGGFLGSSGIK